MVKERTEDIMERRISNFDRSKRFFPIEEIPGHLPNDDKNYSLSPAARRAMRDGSLDPNQTHFNSSINRKIKMRDTFTKIFPSYPHGEPTTYNDPNKSFTHLTIVYPRRVEGKRLHEINREYTHKKDEMK